MVGNSQRRGAKRSAGSKKGAVVGSGGQRRRGLRGKGPTPKAEERTGHVAARRASSAARAERSGSPRSGAARPGARSGAGRPATSRAPGPRSSGGRPTTETVAGRNAVVEALRARVPVKALYVAERIDGDDRVREALRLSAERGVPLLEAPRAELDRITDGSVHQGLVLQVPAYRYAHPDDLPQRAADAGEAALLIALDGVTDPRNLGAVVRSAAAFGAHGVVVPERRAAGMTTSAWKASAGAAARLPVAQATNLARQLRSYAEAGLFVVGLAADADVDLEDLEVTTEPVVVVLGSEGKGLSRVAAQACDVLVRIPMASDVESLNAGVAAGIVLQDVAARRRRAA